MLASGMAHLRVRHERLELARGQRHQLRYAGQVPVGIGHHRVADVGGQGQHRLIDIDILRMPAQHAANDECMAKIMDARGGVGAAVDPAQLLPQVLENPVHLA
jgi:hypothetical protein